MSELEAHKLAYEGKLIEFKAKCESNPFEDLIRKRDNSARTALHWACAGNREEIVDYLWTSHQVKLDMPDDAGWTPLMICCSVGSNRLVRFLLANGCNANSENENGQRPLHYAASRNFASIARDLVNAGAQVNARDKYGATALHRAASKGNLSVVSVLLEQERNTLDVNVADCEGNTPLHLACEEERVEVVKALLKYGADPFAKNKNQKTPVDASGGALLSLIKGESDQIVK